MNHGPWKVNNSCFLWSLPSPAHKKTQLSYWNHTCQLNGPVQKQHALHHPQILTLQRQRWPMPFELMAIATGGRRVHVENGYTHQNNLVRKHHCVIDLNRAWTLTSACCVRANSCTKQRWRRWTLLHDIMLRCCGWPTSARCERWNPLGRSRKQALVRDRFASRAEFDTSSLRVGQLDRWTRVGDAGQCFMISCLPLSCGWCCFRLLFHFGWCYFLPSLLWVVLFHTQSLSGVVVCLPLSHCVVLLSLHLSFWSGSAISPPPFDGYPFSPPSLEWCCFFPPPFWVVPVSLLLLSGAICLFFRTWSLNWTKPFKKLNCFWEVERSTTPTEEVEKRHQSKRRSGTWLLRSHDEVAWISCHSWWLVKQRNNSWKPSWLPSPHTRKQLKWLEQYKSIAWPSPNNTLFTTH